MTKWQASQTRHQAIFSGSVVEAVSISLIFEKIAIGRPEATIMRRSWPQGSNRANHTLENHSNVDEVRATACNVVSLHSWEGTALKYLWPTLKNFQCATNERQGHLSVTAGERLETAGRRQPGERCWQDCHTQELDDEELLLELCSSN